MIRRLERQEHIETRKLWETVFDEDSREFLDYYYSVKTAENAIYVVEADEAIRAMLQLNPYEIMTADGVKKSNYIVGVATEEAYRGRKYMAGLLKKALCDLYEAKEPFTFLMPAAEAIYYPHGFRFIYRQKRCRIGGKKRKFPEGITCRKAEEKDCRAIAQFAESYLTKRYEIRTKRTPGYYRMMEAEQASEHGGILLLEEGERLLGCLYYAEEDDYMEIREPLLLPGYEELLGTMVYALTGSEERMEICQAFEDGMLKEERAVWEMLPEKEIIMARIVDLSAFFACFRARRTFSVRLCVKDEILTENSGIWHVEGKAGEILSAKKEAEQEEVASGNALGDRSATEEVVTTAELVSWMSGYVCAEEAKDNEAVRELLSGIALWRNVFLNEIV